MIDRSWTWSESAVFFLKYKAVRFLPVVVALACMCGASGCLEDHVSPVVVWAERDSFGAPTGPAPYSLPGIFDRDNDRISLSGALNEVVSFRLLLYGPDELDVACGPFESKTSGSVQDNVSVFRAHHVQLKQWPGWHIKHIAPHDREELVADVLVPADAPKGGLPAYGTTDDPLELWVDVRIPKGIVPGDYVAHLNILSASQVTRELDVELRVWPFVLPDDAAPIIVADIDHRALFHHQVWAGDSGRGPSRILASDPAAGMLEGALTSAMRLLADHGVVGQLPHLYPLYKVEADGQISVDWTDYDRVVERYLDGMAFSNRIGVPTWQLPFDERFPPRPSYGAMESPVFSRHLFSYLSAMADHFHNRGWLERSYLLLDEGGDLNAIPHFGYIAREANPRLKLMAASFPQDMGRYGWYGFEHRDWTDYVDVWRPAGQFLDTRAIKKDFGSRAWLTVDRPPYTGSHSLAAPSAATRMIAWQGVREGVEAVYLGCANNWPTEAGYGCGPQTCAEYNSDLLVYPGAMFGLAEPVPSARLKRLRRSHFDAGYLSLLNYADLEYVRSTLLDSLVPIGGTDAYGNNPVDGYWRSWANDPRWWVDARCIMAAELIRASEETDSVTVKHDSVRWQRFMEVTRRPAINAVGVRIRPGGQRIGDELDVEVVVEIINRTRLPLVGELHFEGLPVGWKTTPASSRRISIDSGERSEIVLSARASGLAWGANGIASLPLLFEEQDGAKHRVDARMCHLIPQRLEGSLILDGKLEDWPTALGNYAGGFVPICGPVQQRQADEIGETLCFVGMDSEYLYFGFRCDMIGQRSDEWPGAARNDKEPIPLGQELFEILLDPSGLGSSNPGDLYRIAVTPAGTTWQRGVSTEPPVCSVGSWTAAIDSAIHVADDHWSGEVRVPLRSLDEGRYRPGTWAVGFSRFDLDRQTYSTWSGARGYAYRPASFGNMTVP